MRKMLGVHGRTIAFVICITSVLLSPISAKQLRRRVMKRDENSKHAPVLLNEFVIVDSLTAEDEARMLGASISMSFESGSLSSVNTLYEGEQGGEACETDDQSKAPGNACSRVTIAKQSSKRIIDLNYQDLKPAIHITNGDEKKYGPDSAFPFIGNFHKTLPHNSDGTVNVDAYLLLVNNCIANTNVTACSEVPGKGKLANSLGGSYLPASGVPPFAFVLPPPPSVDSAELALMYAEVAWMALLRDVPFSQYKDNPLVQEAATRLSEMAAQPDINNDLWRRPVGNDGEIDPATQLFRLDFEGITDGPIVSQFLHETFQTDGIVVDPKITTIVPGSDTMTTFDEFLCIQNGETECFDAPQRDSIPRYIRNARDLGFVSQNDIVTSIYQRASKIEGLLLPQVSFYQNVDRQDGFSTHGLARISEQIVAAAAGVSPTWFSKWNVHRTVRPEAYGGLVEQRRVPEGTDFPVHSSLMSNVVIEKMVSKWGSALLPQINNKGCPTHPSYPAGHAMIAGASVTVLKAYMDPDASRCYPFPIKEAASDGLSLNIVIADNTGPGCITVNGELNKLAHNLSMGRDMSGLHFRSDSIGILQGEAYAITYLQDDLDRQPECGTLKFKSFEGEFIELSPRREECKA